MRMAVFAILIFLFFIMCSTSVAISPKFLPLPAPLTGPESLAFDRNGEGPYVSVSDGRVLKFAGLHDGFVEYAYTSPNRNKTICDGLADFSTLQQVCGRPLGLGFNPQTGELYVADAYFGLVKIGPNGGAPTQLVGSVQGKPLRFADGLDVDPDTGIVYFTQASENFQIRDVQALLASRDSSGSLIRYDPSTNQTTVLLKDLALASGVAVSRDGSFVLVTEFLANRIQRFWLKGPRANTSEPFSRLAGRPDNIKRNLRGEFWVAVNTFYGPPPPPTQAVAPTGVRIDEYGMVLQTVSLAEEYSIVAASEVHEVNGSLYGGSLLASYATISTLF